MVALLVVELVLRVVGFSYHLYPEKIEFGAPTPEQIDSGFLADRELLWVTRDYFEKLDSARADPPAVVFLGDSCTEWGNYELYFEDQLLRNFPKATFTYASLGVPGWSSHQGLRQLERDILPLKPRVITVFFGWNDHWKGFGVEDKEAASINSSMLFQIQKYSRLGQLIMKACIGVAHDPERPLLRVAPEDFRSNLTEMARLAREKGVKLVLLTAPTSHQKGKEPEYLGRRHLDDLAELVPLHRQYADIAREVAQREGVLLCDLAEVFEGFDPEVRTSLFSPDGIHLLDEGDRIIGTHMYRCFEQAGLLAGILD